MGRLVHIKRNVPRWRALKALRGDVQAKIDMRYSETHLLEQDIKQHCSGQVLRHGNSFYFVDKNDAMFVKLKYMQNTK